MLKFVDLSHGNKRTSLWVGDKDFKVGDSIRLKGEQNFWRVDRIYQSQDSSKINRNWNVGGI